MRALQGSFGSLRLPLDANHPNKREWLLDICVRLHQLHTWCIGINLIMYEPIWREGDGDEV